MNRLAQPAMTAERQTTQNEITPAANEGDAATPGQSGAVSYTHLTLPTTPYV